MVTSNKFPEKKVVKMAEQNNSVVVPHRTLLGEVNEHITCPLCRGYYIDATTIVECLHSFCRSCIIKHLQAKSYCPECEMMINSARPNIKPDKALQDIVYKLVPGLFQREMERRQQFYSSRPGPAATATPEQRGEDTERIIFSPEDVISFSLEYADATDTDSISSKSSDSNDQQPPSTTTRRFLQCPAVVNISHLKKFISMKFDIDSTQYSIDILYKKVPLPDYYTLMDIAYIYNWKRNEPMRFFYQITDYIAIRNRYGLFDMNSKGSHFHDHKSSPTPTEETNADSPAPNINDHRSEPSSGTDSPMPEESAIKKATDVVTQLEKQVQGLKDDNKQEVVGTSKNSSLSKKCDDEVEKSQFLNSFELTAKSNSCSSKPASLKSINDNGNTDKNNKEIVSNVKVQINSSKVEDTLKRKPHTSATSPEVKKIKIELDKIKIQPKTPAVPSRNILHSSSSSVPPTLEGKNIDISDKKKELPIHKIPQTSTINSPTSTPTSLTLPVKDIKQNMVQKQQISKIQTPENTHIKRPIPGSHHISSPKRKTNDNLSVSNKAVSPLKLQSPKAETSSNTKSAESLKPTVKKMPDLKPSGSPGLFGMQNKGQMIGKVRMDLLANNSDPTIDRSKILSQVKSSLGNQNPVQMPGQMSGDPLKSLFDSCKINIPSSLSITLTDQKDQRNSNDSTPVEQKKNVANKNLSLVGAGTSGAHKVPSPPVHNYIQILKIPDTDPKQQLKSDNNPQPKAALPKNESVGQSKPSNKSSETSAKGPIPSLKPIADTKLAKQSGSGPVTFQQSFERQLLSIQTDKTKLPKNKTQMPKLMPATPKALSAANKLQTSGVSNTSANPPAVENKIPARTDNALDLSTPHNIHSQLGPQHTKAFETMQSIANLAKKQNLAGKSVPIALSQNMFSISNRSMSTGSMPLKMSPTPTPSPSYQMHDSHPHSSPSTAQPSPRSQTRSPSSSPKLVIAEEKHTSSTSEQNINQSNQITSTQIPSLSASKPESPKSSPGPSKQTMKPVKSLIPGKVSGIRQPMMINNPDFQMQMQHAMLRQHMEIQNAWFKAQRLMSHQNINKDTKQ